MNGAGNRPTKIKLPYGAKVNTPDFGSGNPRSNRGGATKKYPCGEMVAAQHSKCCTVMVCRFESGHGYKVIEIQLTMFVRT